jgi:outer membrane receptor protein involved in Fe transport
MKNRLRSIGLKMAACTALALVPAMPLHAQSVAVTHLEIPSQPLDRALRQVARQTGAQIMFSPQQVAGLTSPRLVGDLTAMEAVQQLIAGTGLVAVESASAIIIRGKAQTGAADKTPTTGGSNDIVVTGSRIRGATVASPEITLSRDDIVRAGQSNLSEAIRSLPQNFSGGQNPMVAMGAGGSQNINIGAGSTLNLRGIGQDATLTLINGHRVAYNAAYQGIDVSSIPLAAIDRLEIVTDGSSALYGSDAVGGVANIILRQDYDGLWASARLGAATDGGDFQQQYSAVAGKRWNNGGFIATYDFGRDTAVTADDRSYTSHLNPAQTLVPYLKHHSALISAHQNLLPDLEFKVDATFNDRWSNATTPVNPTGSYLAYGLLSDNHTVSYSVAPSLTYQFADGWHSTLLGVHGEDTTDYGSDLYLNGENISPTKGCYCNKFDNVELSAEGPLFPLPGGSARLAFGGGYRSNGFHAFRTVGDPQDVDVRQSVYYAYGELYLPFVSPNQAIPGLSALSLDVALRYEDYTGTDRLVTPKLGISYEPVPGLQIKGTWGKSFRAPTLYEQYTVQYANLYAAAAVGGSGYPASSTAIVLSGANPDLKSERATSWTVTAVVAPIGFSGFHAEISYFHINYDDRVVTPITSTSAALANPAYTTLIDYDPSASDVERVSSAPFRLQNLSGMTFDPASVVALIDNRNRNIASELIEGVDGSARYSLTTPGAGSFTLLGNLVYLDSHQRLGTNLGELAATGVIFYPPHLRGRAGLLWDKGAISLSSFVNYIGGVTDNRKVPTVRVGSMTTLDFSVRVDLDSAGGPLRNSQVLLAVRNLNNAKPTAIRTTASYFPPYDSTNYSPLGRFVSLTLSKHW